MSLLVYVTVPDEREALTLARMLVEAGECLLLAQVSRAAFEDFCAAVRAAHSYEVPCIVALPLEAGHRPFLRWIEENSLPSAL